MKFPKALSKERVSDRLKSLGKLRIKISHSSLMTFSVLLLILFIAFTVRIFPLRWEIQTGALHLSEFDPYYQYSLANYMVKNGLISPYWPTPWIDKQRWYPDGINMANSFPALPMTAAFFYNIISALGVNIELMDFCAIFPAIFGTLACLIIYFVGKDMGGKQRWCAQNNAGTDEPGVQPQYFKEAYFAGLTLSPTDASSKYGRLVPLVCLYEIDWQKYYSSQ